MSRGWGERLCNLSHVRIAPHAQPKQTTVKAISSFYTRVFPHLTLRSRHSINNSNLPSTTATAAPRSPRSPQPHCSLSERTHFNPRALTEVRTRSRAASPPQPKTHPSTLSQKKKKDNVYSSPRLQWPTRHLQASRRCRAALRRSLHRRRPTRRPRRRRRSARLPRHRIHGRLRRHFRRRLTVGEMDVT
jgi:hypothetical protein